MWFRAPETRQASGALSLKERLERFVDQRGFFRKSGEILGPGHELIVERDRCAHVCSQLRSTERASFNADNNADAGSPCVSAHEHFLGLRVAFDH
jgi:hypothetical protein